MNGQRPCRRTGFVWPQGKTSPEQPFPAQPETLSIVHKHFDSGGFFIAEDENMARERICRQHLKKRFVKTSGEKIFGSIETNNQFR